MKLLKQVYEHVPGLVLVSSGWSLACDFAGFDPDHGFQTSGISCNLGTLLEVVCRCTLLVPAEMDTQLNLVGKDP